MNKLLLILFLAVGMAQGQTQKSNLKKAYFAGGCFWCVEAVFESLEGVEEAVSGYAGGNYANPTYELVVQGRTGHAEAVEVSYNPLQVSFKTLVTAFFESHDPTTLNQQGPDRGTQYRSIAFYSNAQERQDIESVMAQQARKYKKPLVTEIKPMSLFYAAEGYHQDFEKKNPNNPYIRAVSVPRFEAFKAKRPDLLKKDSH